MAILVITMVDLQCCRCRAKITKILECLKEEFCIEKIEFEDKLNKVIVRGKFDGEKLKTTILCKAGKIVKEIDIVKEWPPKPKEAILVITMVCLCCVCRTKITKILEDLKAEFKIEKIEFEDKLCKVIVRGKFDGEKLKTAILCKACHLVKEIALVDKWPPPPPPPPPPVCKVVPYPYPLPYPFPCQSWPCPPTQPPCKCCKPPPPPPPPPPPCKCQCSHDKDKEKEKEKEKEKDKCKHHCPPCPPCPPNCWPQHPCPPHPWPPVVVCPPADDSSQCSIM